MNESSIGLEPRLRACDLISETLRSRNPLEDHFRQGEPLEGRDEALARAIAMVAMRRLGTIQHALEQRLERGLPRNQDLMTILLCGAAQILFMDIPDHAAVDSAVNLAKNHPPFKHYTGLINALLRRFIRERDAILKDADADPFRDTPDWLVASWSKAYGRPIAERIARSHRDEASIDISCKSDAALWAEKLQGVLLPTGSIRLTTSNPIPSLAGFDEGEWWVQDAAAHIPARLLNVQSHESVLDLCAAPGGKTAQLAATGAKVVAVDRSAKRVERLKENIARLKLDVECLAIDALTLEDRSFDAVLLDAPCSATGTIRRHPDVAWIKTPQDVLKLTALQARLLDKSAQLVKRGGRLVYCTCSLEQSEGLDQVEAFLERHPNFMREKIDAGRFNIPSEWLNVQGDLRTLPFHSLGDVSGFDGFYAAKLVRKD